MADKPCHTDGCPDKEAAIRNLARITGIATTTALAGRMNFMPVAVIFEAGAACARCAEKRWPDA